MKMTFGSEDDTTNSIPVTKFIHSLSKMRLFSLHRNAAILRERKKRLATIEGREVYIGRDDLE